MTMLLASLSVPLAQAGTTIVEPATSMIDEITDPSTACGTDPSWACTWIYDLTGSDTWAGIADWVLAKPLTIVVTVLVAWLVSRFARWLVTRSIERLTGAPHQDRLRRLRARTPGALLGTGEWDPRGEARVHTMIAVCRSLITVFVWFVATVVIFSEIGIDLGPLLATAGILGVALGFGTQAMVRDFIAGFFIVVEDQFGVGDVVDLGGDAKGTVEQVTLRSTRVRDAAGVVWHIGNGQILRVGNKSQEWSRALIDLVVGYDADLAVVRRVMGEVASTLAADPGWSDDVLEAPDVWGIEDLTPDGVVVRMVVKTRPAAQFALLREMRERLISGLADAGISFAAAGAPAEVILRDARVEPTSEPPTAPPPEPPAKA